MLYWLWTQLEMSMFLVYMVFRVALYLGCNTSLTLSVGMKYGKQAIFPVLHRGLCLYRVSELVSAYDLSLTQQTIVFALYHTFSTYHCLGIMRNDLKRFAEYRPQPE